MMPITFVSKDPHISYIDGEGKQQIQVLRGLRDYQMESLLQLYKIYGFTVLDWSMGTK